MPVQSKCSNSVNFHDDYGNLSKEQSFSSWILVYFLFTLNVLYSIVRTPFIFHMMIYIVGYCQHRGKHFTLP